MIHAMCFNWVTHSQFAAQHTDSQLKKEDLFSPRSLQIVLMPRSHQSLNMFKSCLVKHGLKLFSL